MKKPKVPLANTNFARWFGDSKVVDDRELPLVVYHGTTSRFTEFSIQKAGSNYESDSSFLGFYFTAERWIAESVADNSELPGVPHVLEVYLALSNPAIIDMKRSNSSAAPLIEKAKRDGRDGVIVKNWDDGLAPVEDFDGTPLPIADQFVAFAPTQIKSAASNSGEFDPSCPDFTDGAGLPPERELARERF